MFIAFFIVMSILFLFLILYLQPRYGSKTPMIYLSTSSISGAFLVLAAQGFGSSFVYSVRYWSTDNQLVLYPMYFLLVFICGTVLIQIHYLNKSLSSFPSSVVAPIYYVTFSTMTLVASSFLFKGFPVDDITSV